MQRHFDEYHHRHNNVRSLLERVMFYVLRISHSVFHAFRVEERALSVKTEPLEMRYDILSFVRYVASMNDETRMMYPRLKLSFPSPYRSQMARLPRYTPFKTTTSMSATISVPPNALPTCVWTLSAVRSPMCKAHCPPVCRKTWWTMSFSRSCNIRP
jgi:hypothetical protein